MRAICLIAAAVLSIGFQAVAAARAPRLIPCDGDANHDLRVDFDDILTVLSNWNSTSGEGDANEDGDVDFADLTAAISAWSADCAAPYVAGPGATAVARRIVGRDGSPCRLYMCGDSISSDSYGQTNTTPTGFHYGVVRKWMPPNWSGIFMPSNGSAGNRYTFLISTSGVNRLGGSALPGLGPALLPANATDIQFDANASPAGPFQQLYTSQLGYRYGVGAWSANRALVARYIYLANPHSVPLRLRTWRPAFTAVGEHPYANEASPTYITYVDIDIPASPQPDFGAGAYGELPDIDETGRRFITFGVRVFDPVNPGFELAIAGISGSTPRDHTRFGGATLRYSDDALFQLLRALESNTFWIMLGANQNDGTAMHAQLEAGDMSLYRQFMDNVVDRYYDAAVLNKQDPRLLLLSTYKIGWSHTNCSTRWAALKSIAEQRDDTLAVDLYYLCGLNTGPYLVDGAHMNWQGSDYFAAKLWELLTALANRAD